MSEAGLQQAQDKMRAAGAAEVAIRVFSHYYRLLEAGQQGTIRESEIEPVGELPQLDRLDTDTESMRAALAETVVIKLNGGLGTSMGVTGPKSALPVKDGLSFLDIIARQILSTRKTYDVPLPLVLMNSFRTRDESLAVLNQYADLPVDGLPLDFQQNMEPKLLAEDLTPVEWPDDPELAWCPPGHGDLFTALVASGTLDALREHGFRHAFISNADNLGATPDGRIAAWMAEHDVPFGMEVCRRTRSDRKGGHVAVRTSDGRLILRDSAQVHADDTASFQDITRHKTFNTNNLWIDLDRLADLMAGHDGVLGLPIIVNHKTVDPADPDSPKVIQLETGMGTAIETFEGSQAVLVDRSRFKPVKTTNDLLVLRSDVYDLDEAGDLTTTHEGDEPYVDLDPDHFKILADFEARFPAGPPSLVRADRLEVRGDVAFGKDVVVVGEVEVTAPEGERLQIADGTELRG
ncbi:UTP--glucose-1-phosphate uridylyltransferase [Kribbella flavida DSM 17836]|uniref:UTP--glucose-1-phosphate uridylyltransferase n=1 Tax=Kribbella flavida (strain DSM 17836 / JCM 10339 / NBRC 14399) TaxID=479435 RepID=D2PQ71_KRIFD|nr:UTP--glucose-1-phosphate uridylyltransferase [Kribbella flavida]ADB34773.1 UTP--glucose-1-phosphate uridylyltransferase [Kribbella flavida DSM 17836]